MDSKLFVIIPAFNEEASIGLVIDDIPVEVAEVVVVSNGSTDDTVATATKHGATVIDESRKGYGWACLAGMHHLGSKAIAKDIIVFLDGDYSDYPEQMLALTSPIQNDEYDLVIGARRKELREKGSMTFPQIFGNWLSTTLMRWLFGSKFTDLGPFRAIRYDKLMALEMEDKTYGWTVEMQLKALKRHYRYMEVAVPYRNRIGVSKVSGTVKGAIFAGVKILSWIFKYGFKK